MFKRVTIVALVVAAFVLVMAVPALAFNGYRSDYTTSDYCSICHKAGQPGSAPKVYDQWALTKHGEDTEAASALTSLPYGSVCAGCHTANYAPAKVTPSPSGTTYVADPGTVTGDQATGNSAASELDIGCSSCHYGATTGDAPQYGNDSNDTAHMVPYGNMADPGICGACHSRYSYTTQTIAVTPVPGATAPTPLIQPQMAIGYPMLGSPAPSPSTGWNPASLADYLNVPHPGWTPTPNPSATAGGFGKLMTYWKLPDANPTAAAHDTPWQQIGHDGSAAQYPEWASEGLAFGHADALTALTSQPFWASFPESVKQSCLECHSADFRIMKESGKSVTSADVKYGITCVGCHTPHDSGTAKGVWNGEFDDQVTVDPANGSAANGSNLCVECHNGEIPAGSTASPGAEVHHPMKEMMDGYGAIDVASFPSVHKGKCIQCHMAPTSWSRGSVQLGANHTFNIITPETANDVLPIPVATVAVKTTATPSGSPTAVVTTTNTVTQDVMPYSACSTCHNNNNGIKATPVPVSSVTTTPSPAASPIQVTVTVVQNANQSAVGNSSGGDRALWLQDTLDQRQSWTTAKIAEIHSELNLAAVRLGYADETAAQTALVAKAAADRTTAETSFLKAFTNVGYVESEGSRGIHNWDYSRQIVNTALFEARSVEAQPAPAPWGVTFKASKTSVKKGTKVSYSGTIAPAEALAFGHATVTLQRSQNGNWTKWKTVVCRADGAYSISVKMNGKGTYKLRALMPAYNAHNMTQGNSGTVTVKVK